MQQYCRAAAQSAAARRCAQQGHEDVSQFYSRGVAKLDVAVASLQVVAAEETGMAVGAELLEDCSYGRAEA